MTNLSFDDDAGREQPSAPGRDLPELIDAILSGTAEQIKVCCSAARSEDIRASLDMLEKAVGFSAWSIQVNPSIFAIGVMAGMAIAEICLQLRAKAEASSDA